MARAMIRECTLTTRSTFVVAITLLTWLGRSLYEVQLDSYSLLTEGIKVLNGVYVSTKEIEFKKLR